MKKFLALMFVCAGLTAMAATPHVNNTAKITKQATHEQVMTAKAMNPAHVQAQAQAKAVTKNSLTPKSFFKQYGLTPENNMLLKNRAPKRVDAGMFGEGTHIDFRYVYTFDTAGYLVENDPFYQGGQGVYFLEDADTMYCAGLYWNPITKNSYYLPLDMDYVNGTVSLELGFRLDNINKTGSYKYYNASTSPVGQAGYVRIDTTLVTYMVNENYFYSEEGDGFDTPVTGTIYKDGSIEFDEETGYAFFGNFKIHVYYKRTQNGSVTDVGEDSTEFINIFRGTQFIVPTGTHEYKYQGSNSSATTYTDDVYAYQYNDTTAVVFNLWAFGTPGNYMFIYEPEEGYYNMYMPGQVVYDAEGYDFMNSTFELDENYGFIFDDEGYVDGFLGIGTVGDATNEYIHWDATVALDTAAGRLLYPLFDNYLRLNDDIWYVGYAETPSITVTPGDDAYTFSGVTEEAGVEVYLFVLQLDEEGQIVDYEMVTNPYTVNRTDVDQVVALGAIADGTPIGKNPSDVFVGEYTVPAKVSAPAYARGDVNMDGDIDINDVTRLIDVVLGKDVLFDENAADCNTETGDDSIDVNDVTALINFVLNGTW